MVGRVRNRNLSLRQNPITQYRFYSPNYLNGPYNGIGGGIYVTSQQSMSDATSPRPYIDKAMSSTRYIVDPLIITGDFKSTYWEMWNGYSPPNLMGYTFCPAITPVNWDHWRTKALANMNPNKPDVDVLVNLFETRDFPKMLQQLGRVLARKIKASDVAGGYLAYAFGWAPLISDLRKLVKLQQLTEKRMRDLTAASKGSRLRRKLGTSYPTRPGPAPYSISWLNAPPSVRGIITYDEELRVWATARLKLLTALPRDHSEFQELAKKLVTGSHMSASTLWEAFPWSWLMDYFLNIGDILEAQRGLIRFAITDMCVMAESKSYMRFKPTSLQGSISTTGGTLVTWVKQRNVYHVPIPMVSYGRFFTTHMYAILGSLVTASALRRYGK